MPDFQIKIDPLQEAAIREALKDIPNGFKKAVVPALNRVAESGRGDISREVRDLTGLKLKEVRRRVTVQRANEAVLSAKIRIRGGGIPLIGFGARQTKLGVTIKNAKAAGVSFVPHAFIATMLKSGHKGVFVRRAGKGRREKRERDGKKWTTQLPIDEVRGHTLSEMLQTDATYVPNKVRDLQEELKKQLSSQVSRWTKGKIKLREF